MDNSTIQKLKQLALQKQSEVADYKQMIEAAESNFQVAQETIDSEIQSYKDSVEPQIAILQERIVILTQVLTDNNIEIPQQEEI